MSSALRIVGPQCEAICYGMIAIEETSTGCYGLIPADESKCGRAFPPLNDNGRINNLINIAARFRKVSVGMFLMAFPRSSSGYILVG